MSQLPQLSLRVFALALLLTASATLHAQIFNAPAPQPNATVQQAAGQQAVGDSQAGEVKQTAWSGFPLPKITMPKVTMPKIKLPKMDTVLAPVKSGYGKVKAGGKKAWEGTKEIFTVGQSKSAKASAQKKVPWWKRLVTPAPEPDGPQTVAEWMSQPRIDP